MAFEQRLVKLAAGTHDRLTVVKNELEAEKNRRVTYDEATAYLLDYRDAKQPIIEAHVSGVITREPRP